MAQEERATVKLQYGTYEAEVIVYCRDNDEDEQIIARAWGQVRNWLTLPMAYKSAKITERKKWSEYE